MFAEEIRLPAEKRAALEGKLAEYRARPELWGKMSRSQLRENETKIAVLERLLQDGVAYAQEVKAYLREEGQYDPAAFENAVGVINNYVIGRPANVDGTGLDQNGPSVADYAALGYSKEDVDAVALALVFVF